MTKNTTTFHIIAAMEVHDGKAWVFERDVEFIITTEQPFYRTAVMTVLGALYPNRTFSELVIEEV